MARQAIDTDQVTSVATQLRSINGAINSEFSNTRRRLQPLEGSWNSAAGSAAHTTIYQLFQYNEARSQVLENYIALLEQQVRQGYVNAEEANTSLSAMFK